MQKLDYKLRILLRADTAIIESAYYYEMKQPGLGERFIDVVKDYLVKILENPFIYEQKRKPYREAYLQNFPFVVIFSIDGGTKEVIISDVFHTSKNPNKKP